MDKFLLIAGAALLGFAILGSNGGEPAMTVLADAAPSPNQPATAADAGNGAASFTATRAPDGHFYADVRINGATTRMLVDTGASSVVLNRGDAQRAGLSARRGEFSVTAQTAGGDIALKPVTIDRIALGNVASRNVPALIAEDDLPVSLLGQSFLQRVGSVEISGDRMTLR